MPIGDEKVEVTYRFTDGTEIKALEDLETITEFIETHDYVKVIRCRDCVNYIPEDGGYYPKGYCRATELFWKPEGHCSMGKRPGLEAHIENDGTYE